MGRKTFFIPGLRLGLRIFVGGDYEKNQRQVSLIFEFLVKCLQKVRGH